jgi:uncharacterized membrane protein
MTTRMTNLMSLGLVLLSVALAAALYGRLPEAVPTHWNLAGDADGFTAKPWGAFVLPTTLAGLWLLLQLLPRISPQGFRMDRFLGTFQVVQLSLMTFVFLVSVLGTLAGAGVPVSMKNAIPAALGLLFAVLGNFLGKFRRNFFAGIRTPWTLASEEVWLRTHRLGGKVFVVAGLVLLAAGLLGYGEFALLPTLVVVVVVPVASSFVLYRRLEGFRREPDQE